MRLRAMIQSLFCVSPMTTWQYYAIAIVFYLAAFLVGFYGDLDRMPAFILIYCIAYLKIYKDFVQNGDADFFVDIYGQCKLNRRTLAASFLVQNNYGQVYIFNIFLILTIFLYRIQLPLPIALLAGIVFVALFIELLYRVAQSYSPKTGHLNE